MGPEETQVKEAIDERGYEKEDSIKIESNINPFSHQWKHYAIQQFF